MSDHLSPRWSLPRFLQKGRGETVTCSLRTPSDVVVAPASATYELRDPSGTAVIVASAATITGGTMSYAVPSTFADSHDLPQGIWRETWVATGGSLPTTPYTVEREVRVVRVQPHRVITSEDLFRIVPRWRTSIPKAYSDIGEPIEIAWEELVQRLLGQNLKVWSVLDWYSMALVHKYWAASLVARAFADDVPGDSKMERRAEAFWERAEAELNERLSFIEDLNEDGIPDSSDQVTADADVFLTDLPTVTDGWW